MTRDPKDTGTTDIFAALTPTQKRLIEAGAAIHEVAPEAIDYLHTIFCQTGLPYKDPGDGTPCIDPRDRRSAAHRLAAARGGGQSHGIRAIARLPAPWPRD